MAGSEHSRATPAAALRAPDPGPDSFQPDPGRAQALLQAHVDYRPTNVLQFDSAGPAGSRLLVKDERSRFGLTSFKAAGGIYAVIRLLEKRWHRATGRQLSPDDYRTPAFREFSRSITFTCASAGNHGLAVTRGAKLVGASVRVYLSESVPASFEKRLRADGAEVVRAGTDYEDSMAAAKRDAERNDEELVADASWPGYYEPPALIMEGYTILADELKRHFSESASWPTRVYIQAGVGGLAAAVAHRIRGNWPEQPEIILVEPDAAPCLRTSIAAGEAVRVEGPVSSMGRLDCKMPSLLAMQILARTVDRFLLVSDGQADAAQAKLDDLGVATTASGAAGYAGLLCDSNPPAPDERILVLVTEAAI